MSNKHICFTVAGIFAVVLSLSWLFSLTDPQEVEDHYKKEADAATKEMEARATHAMEVSLQRSKQRQDMILAALKIIKHNPEDMEWLKECLQDPLKTSSLAMMEYCLTVQQVVREDMKKLKKKNPAIHEWTSVCLQNPKTLDVSQMKDYCIGIGFHLAKALEQ